MIAILEELKKGNTKIAPAFKSCVKFWAKLLADADNVSIEKLAKEITIAQFDFEEIAGEQYLGKKMMAYSGFAYLYDDNADDTSENIKLALKLDAAFNCSGCSGEVKFAAKDAAKLYEIYDYT